jgi:hypothetical protein
MDFEWFVANFLKISFIVTSPVTFLVGFFLLYDLSTYKKVEKILAKSYGHNKRIINNLERHRESFQMFLIEKRQVIGVICMLNSIFAVLAILLVFKRY